MNVALTENILEREGCPLHYWTGGKSDHPHVILTHGACVDHHSFDSIIPFLVSDYHVVVWDVRGHGLSQPMGQPLGLALAVEDLLNILETIGIEQAILVGHSNGSYISQEMAFCYPERVRAMVVIDGTCITWIHSPLERFLIRHSGLLMHLMSFELLKTAGLSALSLRADVREYIYRSFSQLTKADFIQIWMSVTQGLHSEPHYRIAQPLLLLHGDQDRTGDILKIAPVWAKREPNCTYLVIPNASHFAMMDNLEFFLEALLPFLAEWGDISFYPS